MTEPPPISVLIIEPNALLRDGIASLIDSEEGMRVVAQEGTTPDLPVLRELQPDVVVVCGDTVDGEAAPLGHLFEAAADAAVIVLTSAQDVTTLARHLADGAAMSLSKSLGATELVSAIKVAVERDDDMVSLAVPRRAVAELVDPAACALEPVETELLQHLRAARSNGEIAASMNVSEATVKRHLSSLYRKLGARSRLDALRLSARTEV